MATQLFLIEETSPGDEFGTFDMVDLLGADQEHIGGRRLSTSRGATARSMTGVDTVAGPTNGIEAINSYSGGPSGARDWTSPPLAAEVTISGSVTWNLRAFESSMNANVAANALLEVVRGDTGAVELIDKTARTAEMAVGAEAANNFSETPAAGVVCRIGDRLRVTLFGDDAGTMASGFTFSFGWNGPTAAANGDSWVQLTENLTFASEPAGTQLFLTNTAASGVSTADVDREAWTSRGASLQNDVTDMVAGPTGNIQVTDTAGGTAVSWFTKELDPVTIEGAVRVDFWGLQSGAIPTYALPVVEIARVDSDGTNPTVWAIGRLGLQYIPTSTAGVITGLISGPPLAISGHQRLRIRLYLNDGFEPMEAGQTITSYYAGTTADANGDTFVTLSQDIFEFGTGPPPPSPYIKPKRMERILVQ